MRRDPASRFADRTSASATGTEFRADDVIDLVIDIRGAVSFDSSRWAARMRRESNVAAEWHAVEAFQGSPNASLTGLALLAQVLL